MESPEKTTLIYDDSISEQDYYKRMEKINKEFLYEGTSIQNLEKACLRLKGKTSLYFKLLPTRRNFEEIRDKYAATVPHLMIYLEDRQITPSSIKEVYVKEKNSYKKESKGYFNW